jgi:hypothetical protein
MGFPFPWDPSRCSCFATLREGSNDFASVPGHHAPTGTSKDEKPAVDVKPLASANETAGRPNPNRPWGTHLALSIQHNLLVSAKWQPGDDLMDLLRHEVQKVRNAPPEIANSILHPEYRTERPEHTKPANMPSNPCNTLRILPTLGPVAPPRPGRACGRCEQHQGRQLRPVTNLYLGAWEGLKDAAVDGNNQAYLCDACLFPSP